MALQYSTQDSAVTVLTTELNSLASGSVCSASSAQSNDQSGEFDLLCTAEIYIAAQGSNRSTGAYLTLYILPTIDGTTYPDTTGDCLENFAVASVMLDGTALAARTITIPEIKLPNSDFKVLLKNGTGQALASSGNTVKLGRWTYRDI
jgi:hypothetical protein